MKVDPEDSMKIEDLEERIIKKDPEEEDRRMKKDPEEEDKKTKKDLEEESRTEDLPDKTESMKTDLLEKIEGLEEIMKKEETEGLPQIGLKSVPSNQEIKNSTLSQKYFILHSGYLNRKSWQKDETRSWRLNRYYQGIHVRKRCFGKGQYSCHFQGYRSCGKGAH